MKPPRTFYGKGIPGVVTRELKGKLIVLEGPDGSGRSTQIALLTEWLERRGHAVEHVGLKRSTLVANELAQAKEGNVLSPRTLSLSTPPISPTSWSTGSSRRCGRDSSSSPTGTSTP
jgi:energy-coupling factor transporter ATP-binding protein EcfA2